MIVIKGVAASPGIAMGKAHVLQDEEIVVSRVSVPKDKVKHEVRRFRQAMEETFRDLDRTEIKVLRRLGRQHAKLIDAHRLILEDPLFTKDVPHRITDEQVNADFALSEVLEQANREFEKIEDEFFRERRHDLFDVGRRLLSHLLNRRRGPGLEEIVEPVILIARNLLPSDALNLKESKVLGFATDLGGKTSHTAILAQHLKIPAVVGLSDASLRVKAGDEVILDGEQGLVLICPTPEAQERYRKIQEKAQEAERALESLRGLPCRTADGAAVELAANMDSVEDLPALRDLQVEGVGLFRTEFLFLNRTDPPSEVEQEGAYGKALKTLGKPVVIRTMDLGGDRLSALGLEGPASEANPFLGLRGIRLSLKHSELLRVQLRAILRASRFGEARIMFPMVSSLRELEAARRILAGARSELLKEGVELPEKIPVGIMVEVPSTAILLEAFLPSVDFVSVGTNDLIQYILAVDRLNEYVAHLYDPLHPAVLKILAGAVRAAHAAGKKITVCGEMASDPASAPLLVGLGVDVLSVSPRMYLRIKDCVRRIRRDEMARLAEEAATLPDSGEVHRRLEQALIGKR